jgi:predicted DCC family thiol-disulfide oxidoreductase YuxK
VSWVLFFDGECGFCEKSVMRVYGFDEQGRIHFAPLQGKLAEQHGLTGYADREGGSMVLLRESDGEMFTKSDALVELGKALGGVFCLSAVVFSWFPKCLRDGMYDLVARNRFKLPASCELPDAELKKRMRE